MVGSICGLNELLAALRQTLRRALLQLPVRSRSGRAASARVRLRPLESRRRRSLRRFLRRRSCHRWRCGRGGLPRPRHTYSQDPRRRRRRRRHSDCEGRLHSVRRVHWLSIRAGDLGVVGPGSAYTLFEEETVFWTACAGRVTCRTQGGCRLGILLRAAAHLNSRAAPASER